MAMVLRKSYLTGAQCNSYLKDSPLKGLGSVFLQAELQTGIAADLLMALCKQESNLGRHAWSKAPYHNCTNWGIADSGPTSESKFSSFTECILNTAKWVKGRFLNPTNWRYTTCLSHKPPYNPLSVEGVGFHYASDTNWAAAVNRIQKEILTFMPEEVSVKQDAVAECHLNEPVDWNAAMTYLTYAWIRHKEKLA